jgi:hypothetical protein
MGFYGYRDRQVGGKHGLKAREAKERTKRKAEQYERGVSRFSQPTVHKPTAIPATQEKRKGMLARIAGKVRGMFKRGQ